MYIQFIFTGKNFENPYNGNCMDLYWNWNGFLIIHNNWIFPYYGYSRGVHRIGLDVYNPTIA